MRLLVFLAVLLLAATTQPRAAGFLHRGGKAAPDSYQGPCDTLGGGCAVAFSMARGMRAAYTGSLFQLSNGSTTLDVGQVSHVVDTSGIPVFCAGVLNGCVISGIYDQVSGTLMVPAVYSGICTGGGNTCASPYLVDPGTGLPVLATIPPARYDGLFTAINGGSTDPTSVFFYGRNDQFPFLFGTGHAPDGPLTNGTDFIATMWYSNLPALTAPPWTSGYINCLAVTAACLLIDEETSAEPFTNSTKPGAVGATYDTGAAATDINVMITYDGGGATGTVKGYTNSATALFTTTPPSSYQYDSSVLAPNQHAKIGCGGDCTQGSGIFREGLVANALLAGSDYTALAGNVSSFYAGHTTGGTCHGGADTAYTPSRNPIMLYQEYGAFTPPYSGWTSYGLAQLSASYFGPVADINDGTTTRTYSSALAAGGAGCGLDPQAATDCSGKTCKVVKLYNQGTWNADTHLGNVHDTTLDIDFGAGAEPTVQFNDLGGLPTMHFSGSQYGCSTGGGGVSGYFAFSGVAKRTGNTSARGIVFDSDNLRIGFNDSADNARFSVGGGLAVAATDNQWHHIYMENLGSSTWHPYVDGSAASTISSATVGLSSTVCIGGVASGDKLTGDIAEINIISVMSLATGGAASAESAMFGVMEEKWGSLPN